MRFEEVIRTQAKIRYWLPITGLATICADLLDARDFDRLVPTLPAHPSQLIETLSEETRNKLKNVPHSDDRLSGLIGFAALDLPYALADETTVPGQSFPLKLIRKIISIGRRNGAVVDILANMGAVFDRLSERAQSYARDISGHSNRDVYIRIPEITSNFTQGAGLSWALISSDDKLRHALAGLTLEACDVGGPTDAYSHIGLLYDHVAAIDNRLSDATKDALGWEAKARDTGKQMRALEDRFRGAEAQSGATLNELKALKSAPASPNKASITQTQERDVDAETLVEMYGNEAKAERQRRESAEDKLRFAGIRIASLHTANQRLVQQLAAAGGKRIANGTGIDMYAADTLAERYSSIVSYRDKDYSDGKYVPYLEQVITRICKSIKDEGDESMTKTFNWYPGPRCHVFKADATRVFFTSDFKTKLTIHDIVTPAEHQECVSSKKGYYARIQNGQIPYDIGTDGRRILVTLDELLGAVGKA